MPSPEVEVITSSNRLKSSRVSAIDTPLLSWLLAQIASSSVFALALAVALPDLAA